MGEVLGWPEDEVHVTIGKSGHLNVSFVLSGNARNLVVPDEPFCLTGIQEHLHPDPLVIDIPVRLGKVIATGDHPSFLGLPQGDLAVPHVNGEVHLDDPLVLVRINAALFAYGF
jgi:hypothetical protein